MEQCTCFLLVMIFAHTHSVSFTPNINSRRVNLALETVLEFNDKDKQADIKLLDNIQHVITEIRTVIDKNNNVSKVKNFRRNSRDDTLTDFIQEAVNIINTYDDTAFEDFVRILNKEIRKFHYSGCKFYELMENIEIEKLISAKFDSIKGIATHVKKAKINAVSSVLKYEIYDDNVKEIVDYINSLYRQAGDKFQKVLSDLEGYGKSKSRKSDLVKIIKNGLRSIIFDHYTNLSIHQRRNLKRKIETFWKRYKNPPKHNIAKVKPNNLKNSRNIMNENKNLKPDPKKHKRTNKQKTKLRKIKTKHSEHKREISKHKDMKSPKKRNKHTTKDNSDEPREIQEKKTKQTIHDTDLDDKQWTDNKQPKEIDSLSAPLDSIESNKDQQYKIPRKKGHKLKKLTKKSEEIESLNLATSIPINNTTQKNLIWIEESTGRLPQAVLDKLANKSRGQKSNHNLSKKINKNDYKYKKNKSHKKRHGKRFEHSTTRRIGNEVEYDKVHEKKHNLKNQRHKNRYSDPKHDMPYETEDDKTFENINELLHKKVHGSKYESEYEKTNEKVYDTKNEKNHAKIYESEYHKKHDKVHAPENEKTHGKVRQHNKTHGGIKDRKQELNRKHLDKYQHNKRKRPLGMDKKNHRQISSTTKPFLKMLDVQMPETTNKASKSVARRIAATSKLPGLVRHPKVEENEEEDMKPTEQTLPPPVFVKNPERPFKEDKNVANTNTEEESKVKHRFIVKSNIVKPKEGVTISASDVNQFLDDYDNKLELEESGSNKMQSIYKDEDFENLEKVKKPETKFPSEYANEFDSNDMLKQDKPKMVGSENQKRKSLIDYVTDRYSKINKYDKEPGIMTEIGTKVDPIDYKVRQDKLKITGIAVNKKEFPIEEHKGSKINLSGTGFRSSGKLISVDDNVRPNEINERKTDFLIQNTADKDSNNKEKVIKTDMKSKNTLIPVTNVTPNDNKISRNELKKKELADIKRNFRAATDKNSEKTNTEYKKSETTLRLDGNKDFQVKQNKLNSPKTEDNEIEPINEINHVKDIHFTINELGNVFEKPNKFETTFQKSDLNTIVENMKDTKSKRNLVGTPDIISEFPQAQDKNSNNKIENGLIFRSKSNNFNNETDKTVTEFINKQAQVKDFKFNTQNGIKSETKFRSDPNKFKDKTDQKVRATVLNKTDLTEKDSIRKEEIVDDHRIYRVNDQPSVIGNTAKEDHNIKSIKKQGIVKEDINIINSNTVTLEAKYKPIHDMKDKKTGQNLIHNDGNVVSKVTRTSTPIKSTKSTKATVNTTVTVTSPITVKVTVPVSVPVVTSSKVDALKKELDATVKKEKIEMSNKLPVVAVKTTLNVSQTHSGEVKKFVFFNANVTVPFTS